MKWYNIKEEKPEEGKIVFVCWQDYYKQFALMRYVSQNKGEVAGWWVEVCLGRNGTIDEYPADYLDEAECDIYWRELGEDTSIFDF